MDKLLLHIPHSSTFIPESYWGNHFLLSRKEVEQFNTEITDLFTDELFGSNDYEKIVFPISRIVCDVEKFADDKKEPMSKFGMGAVYYKTNEGKILFNPSPEYRRRILENYYIPYHNNLTDITMRFKRIFSSVLMVDCHSFSENIIMDKEKRDNLPDICIGLNEHSDFDCAGFIRKYFEGKGYFVTVNYPYCGSMVPNGVKEDGKSFRSVMIEVNRKLYLNRDKIKNENFEVLKQQINRLFTVLSG